MPNFPGLVWAIIIALVAILTYVVLVRGGR